MSRFPNEYDDGYDGRDAFERAECDTEDSLREPDGGPSQVPTVEQVMSNPGTTFWLARALSSADTRDPVDALRDAELLTAVLRAKLANIQGRAA